ncbi:MAG: DUF4258 domain-containing protein [Microcystis aeruginosa BS13-02]|uniref:DUF4258 domain-containing protein n=1 Tax=Microcystis TaxID=1125 RepID=UPI00232B063D|nr:DUF4258 domain-containing protein [Microcystis aeruginosa]MDB9507519.1 DUF4258 domain-containing protein [Microcystis aeruginosa CS-338/01]NCS24794.1 DUF4258 domain-containing protein [Microcystis aeruginosa BS13-02]
MSIIESQDASENPEDLTEIQQNDDEALAQWEQEQSQLEETEYILKDHVLQEMEKRDIPPELVKSVLNNPEQIVSGYNNRKVYQSRLDFGDGKEYLLRLIVESDREPIEVITAYRTSKINKYWGKP